MVRVVPRKSKHQTVGSGYADGLFIRNQRLHDFISVALSSCDDSCDGTQSGNIAVPHINFTQRLASHHPIQ